MSKVISFVCCAILACCVTSLGAIEERLLLVTGCARSGTKYISDILQKCGLDIGHEKIGKDGASSWLMLTDAKQVPYGDASFGIKFQHTFHQVRHPLQVIASVYTNRPQKSWDFVQVHIPEIHPADSRMVKSAKYWYYWNLWAEKKAEWTYQVEQLEDVWEEFQTRLGRKLDRKALNIVPQDTNHKQEVKELSWEELEQQIDADLYRKIRELALSYGYLD